MKRIVLLMMVLIVPLVASDVHPTILASPSPVSMTEWFVKELVMFTIAGLLIVKAIKYLKRTS